MLPSYRRNIVEATPSRARAGGRRRALSLATVLVSLVIVVLATVSVASTFLALRATGERNRCQDELATASQALDQCVVTAATHGDLKGIKMQAARKELLQGALHYYQD